MTEPDTESRWRTFEVHERAGEVHCGAGIWALDKPERVLSHPNPPARRDRRAILGVPYDFEDEAFIGNAAGGGPGPRAWLIHRLDRETSGLILLALEGDLAARLKELFSERDVAKEYVALVRGSVAPRQGVWRDRLERSRQGARIDVRSRRGPPNALSRYRVLETFAAAGVTLLSLSPETGRTHQLRVQAAARGHPIAGDERYGDFAWNRRLRRDIGLERMFLHARRLALRHPRTGEEIRLESPPGAALDGVLDVLRAGGRRRR